MTTLLLDAGNTRLKWALCGPGQRSAPAPAQLVLLHPGSLSYDWLNLPSQMVATLGSLLATRGDITHVLLCNVAGEKLDVPLRQCLAALQVQESLTLTIDTVIAQADAFGVQSVYRQPEQLGADRWAALVAARHFSDASKSATCIIDCGTALTVDVLTARGHHAGGIIVPGATMMMASLYENTDAIVAGEWGQCSPLSVRSTNEAVQAGVLAALTGAVQRVLQQCQDELGEQAACVLTGGNAEKLMSSLPKARYEPDWVLKGLAVIAGCCRS